MASLSTLGLIHTAISVVALVSGFIAVAKPRGISWGDREGRIYIIATLLTCLTAFGIFQHGGLNKAHALGVVTLLVLAGAYVADRRVPSSAWAHYVAPLGYTTTLFLHLIPGVTETFTRIPVGSPVFNGPEDPALQQLIGGLFGAYLVGVALQVRQLRRNKPVAKQGVSIA